jgi:cytochrome c biogenesis protein CcmG, thiol:disulfide interchange protein DsbE
VKGRAAWILPLSAVPFLALLLFGLMRDVDFFPTPLIDQPAPAWHLETLEDDSLSLDELRGKVVLLNFWASWCLACRVEHPVLLRAARTWPEDDVQLVGIVYNDSRRNAIRYLDELGNAWRNVMDPGSRTAIDYGVHGVPETFFIDPEGKIRMKHIGPLTWDVVKTNVDSLLAGPAVVAGAE